VELKHVAALLGLMATFDYRETDETDDRAWLAVLGDLEFKDCEVAVFEHYKDSGDRMKPVDVRRGVKRIREARARRNGAAPETGLPADIPDADPDDVAAYLAAVREQRVRCGGQLTPRPVGALLAGRPFQVVPTVSAAEVRREIRALPASRIGGER
jgi:hypothetical protein